MDKDTLQHSIAPPASAADDASGGDHSALTRREALERLGYLAGYTSPVVLTLLLTPRTSAASPPPPPPPPGGGGGES